MSKLHSDIADKMMPIYELTKSRKAKKAPDGDIHRRMSSIKEIQGDRPFILDLSANEKYVNTQIEQLINPKNGYYEWQYFLSIYGGLNIIPMVHLYDDDDFTEVEKFVRDVSVSKGKIAVRLPYDLDNFQKFVAPIVNNLQNDCKLYVILDGGQVNGKVKKVVDGFRLACSELKVLDKIEDIIIVTTSFPRSPASLGDDDQGEFPILEESIFKETSNFYPVKYGDYASINIEQVEIKGGTFVPRIDISLNEKFIYKRYRRNAGSYALCAQKMIKDGRYKSIGIWADDEIILAYNETPSGISPSFWIAVRMNYFMTTRVKLRSF